MKFVVEVHARRIIVSLMSMTLRLRPPRRGSPAGRGRTFRRRRLALPERSMSWEALVLSARQNVTICAVVTGPTKGDNKETTICALLKDSSLPTDCGVVVGHLVVDDRKVY